MIPNEILDMLLPLGYEAELHDETVIVKLEGFNASLNVINDNLVINCQISRVDELTDLDDFAKAALLQNSVIQPFAFALLDGGEEGFGDDLIVLTSSLPLDYLCPDELNTTLRSLRQAILTSAETLRLAITNQEPVCN
jgi:hypothetical protein